MDKFYKIEIVSISYVDKYLSSGWVLINNTKEVFEDGSEVLQYHLGYPIEKQLEDTMSLIKSYEENGFREELFKKIADENGLNVEDYEVSTGRHGEDNNLTKFMQKYDFISFNTSRKYCKKKNQEELNAMMSFL